MSDTFEFIDIGSDDPNVIAVRTTGKLRAEPLTQLWDALEKIREGGGKARIYLDMVGYEDFESQIVKDKLSHLRTIWTTIDRLAYVVDKEWIAKVIPLVDAVTPMHLRAFGPDEAEAARNWLLSSDDA